ncbi:YtxH domain-containing protein [Ochrovirga pacifica]|uniref:YtxH domain-containing protein n=1 Tax=Ochrovirga pacifica TaxID=1042376 RepID=UPI0002558E82|nr:YtxH domain-containing protein [Ochrovirga pacifica]
MSNQQNTALGVLAGMATGALVGVLFAPNKGSKTRKMIKEKISETGDLIADEAVNLRDNVADTISTKKETLEEEIDRIVTKSSHKADDIINTLESQLEALKKQNKKLQK